MQSVIERAPVYTNGRPTEIVAQKRSTRVTVAWLLLFVAALGFLAAGPYAIVRGFDARGDVAAQLKAEHITTPEDASIPNVPVVDDKTAMAQADIINKHALEATGGKTYAQMDREDPLRPVAASAASLRTALMSAALAWNTANLVIGVGAFITAVGGLLLVTLLLLKPKKA